MSLSGSLPFDTHVLTLEEGSAARLNQHDMVIDAGLRLDGFPMVTKSSTPSKLNPFLDLPKVHAGQFGQACFRSPSFGGVIPDESNALFPEVSSNFHQPTNPEFMSPKNGVPLTSTPSTCATNISVDVIAESPLFKTKTLLPPFEQNAAPAGIVIAFFVCEENILENQV